MNIVVILVPLVISVLLFSIQALSVPIMVWLERRGAGFIQNRLGPNVVGPWGLLQPIVDGVKIFFKEDAKPQRADFFCFYAAPIVVVLLAVASLAVIPFGDTFVLGGQTYAFQVANIPVGILYLAAVGSFSVYGALLAGWASGSKYSLFGGMRASAQMISYEIGMGIGFVTMILVYGSFDLQAIVASQAASLWDWGLFRAPLVFFLLFMSIFAETNRLPFDLAEGEAEIVGFHVEYSSMKFAFFFMGEYMHMFIGAAIMACLFLGGWHIPGLDYSIISSIIESWGFSVELASIIKVLAQMIVMLVKVAVLLWVFIWVRWSFPRFRYDQLMRFGWQGVIPFALVSLAISALCTYWGVQP